MDPTTQVIILGAKYLIALPILGVLILAFKSTPHTRWELLYLAAAAGALTYTLARLAGLFFSHVQPFAELDVAPLVPHEIDNSFPSDHTALAAAFSTIVWLRERLAGYALFVATVLLGVSRIAAGLHWPVDVAVGIAIGVLAGLLSHKAIRYLRQKPL